MRRAMFAGLALTAAILVATDAAAQAKPGSKAPLAFTQPGVQALGEDMAARCRKYLITANPDSQSSREMAWAAASKGWDTPEQQKLLASFCVTYSTAWQQGGRDLLSSTQGDLLRQASLGD